MGVTIIVALCVWVTGSLIEYRIISRVPAMEKVFHGIPGMFISIAIGMGVGIAIGASTGAGFILGQTIGLATNDFTYKVWCALHKANNYRIIKTAQTKQFYESNKALIHQAADTVRMGMKALAAIFLFFMFIVGLPVRLAEFIQRTITRFKKEVPA